MTYEQRFPGWADHARKMRERTEDILSAHKGFEIPLDTIASAVLLVSEATTHAARHTACGRSGVFKVTLKIDTHRITIESTTKNVPSAG
ncbi:hypothetical protein ACFOVU_01450 [Nocardiopsis sediminis]|uniref:ATP-binding protein n=1 Tax=Nocardiopsis sediminis TaxID=1778267 RepID=A0ABV8FGY5_9ACTN